MINLDNFSFEGETFQHEVLPPDHALVRGQPINLSIFDQDFQWRLKIQPFTNGGFEASAFLINRNRLNRLNYTSQERPKRKKQKVDDPEKNQRNEEKSAWRAAKRVRHLCIEIGVDRLLTLTSRHLLTEYDDVVTTWKRFMRILDSAGARFEYVAVPELHGNGEHYHIHAALNGYIKADLLRRCWQIALGGKGDERGNEALGNVDIKHNKRQSKNPMKRSVTIAKYLSKYITKSYLEHHKFNRKRYWAPRTIKLPESHGEWLQAQTVAEAISELDLRFGDRLMLEASRDSLYISDANVPMIFFRHIPGSEKPSDAPF